MSDVSVPDHEIAHFSFEASPSPLESVAILDLLAISAASVDTSLLVSPLVDFQKKFAGMLEAAQEENRVISRQINEQ